VLYVLKIRLRKNALGSVKGKDKQDKILRFPRGRGGGWEPDQDEWFGFLENARRALNATFDLNSVRFPAEIALPNLHLFTRQYRITGDHRTFHADHEMIPRNYVLTLYVGVLEFQGRTRFQIPDRQQLHDVLAFIGDYEGISPWGRERGHGRFVVESLDPMGRATADHGEFPSGDGAGEPGLHGEEDGEGRLEDEHRVQ
jgi:hypothetical protein